MKSLLQELMQQKVISQVPKDQEGKGFYSHIFMVKKPSGKFRLILNLKVLNRSIKYKKFRMDTIFSVRNLLTPKCHMASIDLRDAYLHIPIAPPSQRFLRLAVNLGGGEIWHLQFRALPFGLSSSPRVFTKVMAESLEPLRLKGISIVPYLDDLLLFADSRGQVEVNLQTVQTHLRGLGWLLNLQKSNLIPSQRVRFLGYEIDSIEQKIFLPQEKIEKMQLTLITLQSNAEISVRQAMSALGLLTAAIPSVQWARLHSRPLQSDILMNWSYQEPLEKKFNLGARAKRSLWWWRNLGNVSKGLPWVFPVTRRLTTDASAWGWGAHLEEKTVQGVWTKPEARRSSNWRELKAVHLSLLSLQEFLVNQHVQILSDNMTTVLYLTKQGGTKSKTLMGLAHQILRWAENNVASLSAVHLKGTENTLADLLSRKEIREAEWSLNQELFEKISKSWGHPQVDLFAKEENAKIPVFFSLQRQDQALGVDALAHKWDFHLSYAFPPFQLIPKVLAKFRLESTELILIAPYWPKRPWFSTLMNLSVKPAWGLPIRTDLLSQGRILHPDPAYLKLTAWFLKNKS